MSRWRKSWAVGCAVNAEATNLALAIQGAMNDLSASGALQRLFAAANMNWRKV